MEQETYPQRVGTNTQLTRAVVISILLTAVSVGTGVYFWEHAHLGRLKQDSQMQISSLREQILTLRGEYQSLRASSVTSRIKFPLVVYGRPGLLNNTESGKIEKKRLEERLINPFVDYYNEKEVSLVTLFVTVPKHIGGEYTVDAFFVDGGHQGFLFGRREQDYGYWSGPDCMEPCDFSETFKMKYPQIAQ